MIFLPLCLVWGFALVDIFRRNDIGGFSKALWLAFVILVPFLGTIVYLYVRPVGATEQERVDADAANREFIRRYSPEDRASQLETLAGRLHDRGKLTDAEFAAEKARILDGSESPAVTT